MRLHISSEEEIHRDPFRDLVMQNTGYYPIYISFSAGDLGGLRLVPGQAIRIGISKEGMIPRVYLRSFTQQGEVDIQWVDSTSRIELL